MARNKNVIHGADGNWHTAALELLPWEVGIVRTGPLFHSRILQQYMERAPRPITLEPQKAVMAKWIATLESGALHKATELSLHADFLKDIFEGLLGYSGMIAGLGQRWTLSHEQLTTARGGTADGAVGFFTPDKARIVAPIELKSASTDLDRSRSAATGFSPVQQGWRYADEIPGCKWIIVSNYIEIRLYHRDMTPVRYESFGLRDLADNGTLLRFLSLLSASSFLSEHGPSLIDRLIEDTGEEEKGITKDFYAKYAEIRIRMLRSMRDSNPGVSDDTLISAAQKILDRILFVCFAEDRGLLPRNTLAKTAKGPKPPGMTRWSLFHGLFAAINRGDTDAFIPGYNGGLFAEDPAFDTLVVHDDVCTACMDLISYDYGSELSVEILGRVFEQSIMDLEVLKTKGIVPKQSKRKKGGIYYTPSWITNYIVEHTVGTSLEERFAAIRDRVDPEGRRGKRQREAAWREVWEEYKKVLSSIRVCDPACGSGAFLVAAFDRLLLEYERVNDNLAILGGNGEAHRTLFDLNAKILTDNLYGVDISPESVEITKLSLWLKTAERGKTLTSLDNNIKCGNSIVSDRDADPRAFDWAAGFPEVFFEGGFDVVVGNPPYVKIQNFKPDHPKEATWISENYSSATGSYDLYLPFIERGLSLLRPGGIMGYIAPNVWIRNEYGLGLRRLIRHSQGLSQWIDFHDYQVWDGATTYTALQFFRAGQNAKIRHADAPDGDLSKLTWSSTPYASLGDEEWALISDSERKLIARLSHVYPSLGEIARVIVGVQTSADVIYHLRRIKDGLYYSHSLDRPVEIEDTIMRPLVRGDDAQVPYMFPHTSTHLLFPYAIDAERATVFSKEFLASQFPKAHAYLVENADALKARERGKFADDSEWWKFGRHQNMDKHVRPKIGVPSTVPSLRAFCDERGELFFHNVRVNGILVEGDNVNLLWYVTGILNSRVADFVFRRIAKPKAGGYFEANKQFIAPIPIPRPDSKTMEAIGAITREIAALYASVETIERDVIHRLQMDIMDSLALPPALTKWEDMSFAEIRKALKKAKTDIPIGERKQWEQYIAGQRARIDRVRSEIARIENTINRMVYRAYGLTAEEIAMVEADMPAQKTGRATVTVGS